MGMRLRLVVLAIAVAALAVWLFAVELPGDRRIEAEFEAERVLLPIDPAVVDTLRVERADEPWTLVRRDDGWWIERPIVERAQDRVVESVIERLTEQLSHRRFDPGEGGLEAYALSPGHPGRVDFVLASHDGRSARLAVGLDVFSGDYCYVQRGDREALDLALISVYELAHASHHGFRRSALFGVDAYDDVLRLDGMGPAGEWTAVRDTTTGLWWSGEDRQPPRLKRWLLDDLALGVASQNVNRYLNDGLSEQEWAAYGLDQPWAELRVTARSGRTWTVWLGNEVDRSVYFGRKRGLDTVFTLRPGFLGPLVGAEDYVDRNPVPWNLRRVDTIEVSDDSGRKAELRREDRDWNAEIATGPVTLDRYSETAVNNVTRGLEELQPRRALIVAEGRGPRSPFEELVAEVRLRRGDEGLELAFGLVPGEVEAWMHVEGDPTLYEIDRSFLLRLRGLIDALYEAD